MARTYRLADLGNGDGGKELPRGKAAGAAGGGRPLEPVQLRAREVTARYGWKPVDAGPLASGGAAQAVPP